MTDGINSQKLNPGNRFLGKFAKFTVLEKRQSMVLKNPILYIVHQKLLKKNSSFL